MVLDMDGSFLREMLTLSYSALPNILYALIYSRFAVVLFPFESSRKTDSQKADTLDKSVSDFQSV